MPSLIVLKGTTPGEKIKLDGDLFILGRNPDCQIVLANNAVSRQHAQIVRVNGQFFIEDLKSRNRTYVNNQDIETKRTPLKDDDRIKICDFLYRFADEKAAPAPVKPLPTDLRKGAAPSEEEEPDGSSTVEATLPPMRAVSFYETQPADKLRALLDISTALGKTLETDGLLSQIADKLFDLFKQADRCFVILTEDGTDHLIPKVVKQRRGTDATARFSRTIVKQCLQTQQSFLSEDASMDGKLALAQSIAEFRIRSVMCVPLLASAGKPLGVIQLDNQDRNKKFREDDLRFLTAVATQAALSLEKAKLVETLLTRERFQRDLELAQQVQRSFLPQIFPEVANYDFYAHYVSAQLVGGDYYDFVPLSGGRVAILLGDVAGKGVSAALMMAKLSAEARYCMLTEPDLAAAVTKLNNQLSHAAELDKFVTLAGVVLDPAKHVATVVNAGHMSPIIYRKATGELVNAISNDQSGLPLATVPDYPYESATVELKSGDTLLMVTDGVTEAMNAAGRTFGFDGLHRAILPDEVSAGELNTPRELGDRVIRAVQQFAAGYSQSDDIALVSLGRVDSLTVVKATKPIPHIGSLTAPIEQDDR